MTHRAFRSEIDFRILFPYRRSQHCSCAARSQTVEASENQVAIFACASRSSVIGLFC